MIESELSFGGWSEMRVEDVRFSDYLRWREDKQVSVIIVKHGFYRVHFRVRRNPLTNQFSQVVSAA